MKIAISIAHATRRPVKALEIRKLWIEAAAHPENVEYIFGIDEDDPESLSILANERHAVSLAGGGGVRAINESAAQTSGDIIIVGADDMYPVKDWDILIPQRFGDVTQPRVLLVSDGVRKDRLATLPIITRAFYNRFGWVFPPQFKTIGPDLWMTERASRDGQLIDAQDLVFEHRHPYYGKAEIDSVYLAQNAPERYAEMWPLLDELLPPLKISACMIVGNEAHLIERCLESFKDSFDELCIVRAIGSQVADNTIELAYAWCERNGKEYQVSEYYNRFAFPHVDNFAAARNHSFSLATGFWQLWIDADDVIDAGSSKGIRDAAKNTRFDGQLFRYTVPSGGEIFRERLIKRGKGTWVNAVHENCTVDGITGAVPNITIHHTGGSEKTISSATRNLAILSTLTDKSPREWFYYQQELFRLGRNEECIAAAHEALKVLPADLGIERYEIYLNLCDLNSARTYDWCHEAIRIDPCRREAFAYVCQCALNCGNLKVAIQYFRFLESIPEPTPKPATHRAVWHSWGRNLLMVRLLKANGKTEDAEKRHAEFMKDPEYAEQAPEYLA